MRFTLALLGSVATINAEEIPRRSLEDQDFDVGGGGGNRKLAWNTKPRWSKPTRSAPAWDGWNQSKPTKRGLRSGWNNWGPSPTKKPTNHPVDSWWGSSWEGEGASTDWVLNGWNEDAWGNNDAWAGSGWGSTPTPPSSDCCLTTYGAVCPGDFPIEVPSHQPGEQGCCKTSKGVLGPSTPACQVTPPPALDLTLTMISIFALSGPVLIFPTLIDGGVSNFGIAPDIAKVDMPDNVSNVVTIPSESETTDADGNIRKEMSIEIIGQTNDLQGLLYIPVFGRAISSKASSKFLEYTVHDEEGKLIESGASILLSGEIVLVDGTKVKGKTFTNGTITTDYNTGIVTSDGETSFHGSIGGPDGKELFNGELKTASIQIYNCSNDQCNGGLFNADGSANGQYLGGGGFNSLNGVSVQEDGATFYGNAESSGKYLSRLVCVCVDLPYTKKYLTVHILSAGAISLDLVDELAVFNGTGYATWSGIYTNSDGVEAVGKWYTDGTFKIDENGKDLGGSGYIFFNGTYTNEDSEFQGLVSSEGDRTVGDSSIQTLKGNVLFLGNLTDTSKELFTMGKWSTSGSLSVDANFTDLGGGGFVEFDGKSNSGVQVLKDLGLYDGGATFEGTVRMEGSRVLNEDGSVTLEGTVQVNNDTLSGNVTVGAPDISLFLASQRLELKLEEEFEAFDENEAQG